MNRAQTGSTFFPVGSVEKQAAKIREEVFRLISPRAPWLPTDDSKALTGVLAPSSACENAFRRDPSWGAAKRG